MEEGKSFSDFSISLPTRESLEKETQESEGKFFKNILFFGGGVKLTSHFKHFSLV